MTLAQTITQPNHWTIIVLAVISAVSAIGAAWAANASRTGTKKLDATNTSQHAGTAGQLTHVAERQEWVINQIAELRQALLDHIMWEQGNGHDGKYNQIERQIAQLETQLKEHP